MLNGDEKGNVFKDQIIQPVEQWRGQWRERTGCTEKDTRDGSNLIDMSQKTVLETFYVGYHLRGDRQKYKACKATHHFK